MTNRCNIAHLLTQVRSTSSCWLSLKCDPPSLVAWHDCPLTLQGHAIVVSAADVTGRRCCGDGWLTTCHRLTLSCSACSLIDSGRPNHTPPPTKRTTTTDPSIVCPKMHRSLLSLKSDEELLTCDKLFYFFDDCLTYFLWRAQQQRWRLSIWNMNDNKSRASVVKRTETEARKIVTVLFESRLTLW